jgi:nucleotide-binding universal stress UspA family protein
MSANRIIVSYDGTHNEDDAIALGRLFARAGSDVSLAYVSHEDTGDGLRASDAETLLERGAAQLGGQEVERHVIVDRSTPEGLRTLAGRLGAKVIVFCSDSHTAFGHIAVGNSAQRLLDGGEFAIAIAPAGLAQRADLQFARIAATDDADDVSARATAEALAGAIHASVSSLGEGSADLLVVGSRPDAPQGRVSLSSAAGRLIEDATCPVLVVPRGSTVAFGGNVAAVGV